MIQYTQTPDYYRDCLMHYDFNDPDFLEHHGVKGQRWGFRKQRVLKGRANRKVNTGSTMTANEKRARTNRRKKIGKIALGAAGIVGAAGAAGALRGKHLYGQTGRREMLKNFGKGTLDGIIPLSLGAGAAGIVAASRNRKLKKKKQNGQSK